MRMEKWDGKGGLGKNSDGTRRGRWDGKGGRDGRERIEGVE